MDNQISLWGSSERVPLRGACASLVGVRVIANLKQVVTVQNGIPSGRFDMVARL